MTTRIADDAGIPNSVRTEWTQSIFTDSVPRIAVPTKINVRIEIMGHKSRRTTAIKRAVLELLGRHRLTHNFSPMKKLLGDDLEMLYFRTLTPIATNGSAKTWVRSLRRKVKSAIVEANRGKCDAKLHAEFMSES